MQFLVNNRSFRGALQNGGSYANLAVNNKLVAVIADHSLVTNP